MGFLITYNVLFIVAGVCGLDLTKLEVASLKQQLSVLEAQLQMARDLSKPVVLFEKSGSTELLHLLRTYPGLSSVVIHGFAGSAQQAKEYLHKGYVRIFLKIP